MRNARNSTVLLWGNSFLAKRTAIELVKIAIVAPVTVGGMAALPHLTHRDMGNVTMMSGTLLTM
ncbi:hypothetical protein [Shewanella putrefaciens]|uniref:hypothetical protein n=1 Tax=Shewanella putrefaciens TaxID=24 RepID=UPI0018E7F670|nr:hypothetical protein [Shewanella putrefaciens]